MTRNRGATVRRLEAAYGGAVCPHCGRELPAPEPERQAEYDWSALTKEELLALTRLLERAAYRKLYGKDPEPIPEGSN